MDTSSSPILLSAVQGLQDGDTMSNTLFAIFKNIYVHFYRVGSNINDRFTKCAGDGQYDSHDAMLFSLIDGNL